MAKHHGAHNVRVFGSVARGEADADSDSDSDLLVDLEPGRNLLDLGGLLMDLRDLLRVSVDVATEAMLKDRIRLADLFALPISLGSVVTLQGAVSQALLPAYTTIEAHVRVAAVVNIDETGWKKAGKRR